MRNILSAQFTADVVAESMGPQFRRGKFGKGLVYGVERYVEAMCLASAEAKEQHIISKWKLNQPGREASPALEQLMRERYRNGEHYHDTRRTSEQRRPHRQHRRASGGGGGKGPNRDYFVSQKVDTAVVGSLVAVVGGLGGMGWWANYTECPICKSWGSAGLRNHLPPFTLTEAT